MRVATAALVLALVAAPAAAPAAAETRIFASLDSVAGQPFQAAVKAAVLEAAKKDPTHVLTVNEIGPDPAQHLRNVEAAIAAKANAVIVNVGDPATARKIAALAAEAGMPLVFLSRRPALDRVGDKVSIVSSNDLVAGRLETRILADRLGGKGTVAILRGPETDAAARERRTGMQEVLAAYPELTVAVEAGADGLRDEARGVVAGWLKEGRTFDAVVSANDEMALGAVAALRSAGLAGKVLVGGIDGGREAIAAVKAGDMACTVLQNAAAQGAQAVANAEKFGRGDYAQPYEWIPYELIVAENVGASIRR